MHKLASYLDFANHHADAAEKDIIQLCQKTIKYQFNSAFVNPCYVSLAKKLTHNQTKVGTVISFPLGQETLPLKIYSAQIAANSGADELDISLNVSLLKQANWSKSLSEMKQIVAAVKKINQSKIIKFILETGFLNSSQIKKAAKLVLSSGADFVKTCSGMGPRGSSLKDIHLIKQAIDDKIKIKVAGGISNYQQAIKFIQAGASRIGTSHAEDIITASLSPLSQSS